MIHIISAYIIDEHSRNADLLENEDILLLLLIHTKLQDWIVFDVSYKFDSSQKLVIDNDDVNALKNYINHKKNSNSSKKTEKNMLTWSHKQKHFKKYFLSTDSSKRKLINIQ